MKILVAYNGNLFPISSDGQSLRIYNIFKILSQKHDLFLYCFKHGKEDFDKIEKQKAEKFFKRVWFDFLDKKICSILFDFISVDYSIKFAYRSKLKIIFKKLDEIISKNKIECIYVNGFPLNRLLAYYSRLPKLLDLCDSRALMRKREYLIKTKSFEKLYVFIKYIRAKNIENFLLCKYQLTTLVSEVDANFILSNHPDVNIQIIPNGVKTEFFKPLPQVKEIFPSLIFFGNMDFPPNIDATFYLFKEIFPKVKKEFPEAKLYIVGRNPSSELTTINGINNTIVTGEVADIRDYIMMATVAIIPMRIGSGIKNKILEAMAMSKPVVSTPLGTEALRPELKKAILIGENAAELSEKVIYLLKNRNKIQEFSDKGVRVVKEYYSWKICAEKYLSAFRELTNNTRSI